MSVIHATTDPAPEETRVKVLRFYASLPWAASATRREAQTGVYGTDRHGAYETIAAVRWLHERGYLEYSPSSRQRYRITASGKAAVGLVDLLDAGTAS